MTPQQLKALKLALEALEANYLLVNGTETHGGLEQCLDGYYSSCFNTDPINKQTEEAITAIKEALAQPEQEPVAWRNAAIRVGEDLSSVGPDGYYDMTAQQWLDWALSVVTVHTSPPQRTEQKMVMWPCLIDTADFSKGTVTVVMQCKDYKVSAGTHWLSTTQPKETK